MTTPPPPTQSKSSPPSALAGWTLLLVTPAMIRDGRAYQWVEAIFHWRREDSASAPAQEPP